MRARRSFDHAIITGGSSGIGKAIARRLVERGVPTVSLLARRADHLRHAALDIAAGAGTPTKIDTAAADVADPVLLDEAIKGLSRAHGPCDLLVAAAGYAHPGRVLDLTLEDISRQMAVNYFGTVNAVMAMAPAMRERGRGTIVGFASAAALFGVFGLGPYGGAKAATLVLLQSLRAELRHDGVDVACVVPPDVDTPGLARENVTKPAETAAISGSISPLSADAVAAAVTGAVERRGRRRFLIVPDPATGAVARLAGLAPEIVTAWADHKVRKVRSNSEADRPLTAAEGPR